MKRAKGFSFIELMTSIAILSVVMGSVVGALVQAQKATNAVALMANTQENLRAGMHFMVRDLTQAGEGVPPQGVFIPLNTAGLSNLNRPGTTPATTAAATHTRITKARMLALNGTASCIGISTGGISIPSACRPQ